ncbi:hypothetical protein GCM10010412_041430 [Nonomuraea recticatena]|uniref:SEFIR domain-containing protein n=1 Tax=Nonomuraea recticatena TaxID=46178 RepID=A0ABP6ECX2_9ACTN
MFISYSHAPGETHKKKVLELSEWLRGKRPPVDSWLDQYVTSPSQGWPAWCIDEMGKADYVLAVCEAKYKECFDRHQPLNIGRGVAWEGLIIVDWLYEHVVAGQVKVIPVVLSKDDMRNCPTVLKRFTIFNAGDTKDRIKLYQHLINQPAIVPAKLGKGAAAVAVKPNNPAPVNDARLKAFKYGARVRARTRTCRLYAEQLQTDVYVAEGSTGIVSQTSMVRDTWRWSVEWDASTLYLFGGGIGHVSKKNIETSGLTAEQVMTYLEVI